MTGLFITFEGGEGAGKSTQIKLLAEHFTSQGRKVVLTREPGGTAMGESIRNLLVNGDPGSLSSMAEALLNSAARDIHLREVIRPALSRGDVVLCDRFMDSTRVYQGIAGECPLGLIDALQTQVVGKTIPDLTFVFDLDPAVGLQRAKRRGEGGEDRYERKGMAFHERVRDGFLVVARDEPTRCVVIDAGRDFTAVYNTIIAAIQVRRLA